MEGHVSQNLNLGFSRQLIQKLEELIRKRREIALKGTPWPPFQEQTVVRQEHNNQKPTTISGEGNDGYKDRRSSLIEMRTELRYFTNLL